jgi:hypothetical protein
MANREQIVVLEPLAQGFDIGNTATTAAVIIVPFKCEVIEAIAWSNTAATNSFTVGFNSYDGTTLSSNAYVGSVVVPDSAGANVAYYDAAGLGVVLEKHSVVMVDCDEAGDSGEKGFARLVVSYLPETDQNDVAVMIESA